MLSAPLQDSSDSLGGIKMQFTEFILTERFEKAILMACALHREQKRKNIPTPFMVHLMSVTSLVCENIGFVCDSPEQCEVYACTAILHDTIEDQGGRATYELLISKFGQEIADNVMMLSDSIPDDKGKKPPKAERNANYLKKMREAPVGIAVISCCDKIHNLRTMAADAMVYESKTEFWSAFSQSPELTVENYRKLRNMYAARINIPRLIAIYDEALASVERLVREC